MMRFLDIFNFKNVNFFVIVVLSVFVLSACNENQNKGGQKHTGKQEVSPLGEGQSVNDEYPTQTPPSTNDTDNNTANTTPEVPDIVLPIANKTELVQDPENIIIDLNFHGTKPTDTTCQVAIVKRAVPASTPLPTDSITSSTDFHITSNSTFGNLSLNDIFISSSIVIYKNNNETMMKDNSGQIFLSLNQSNVSESITEIDASSSGVPLKNSYNVLVICGEAYSNSSNPQMLPIDPNAVITSGGAGNGTVNNTINIVAIQPSTVDMVIPFKLIPDKLLISVDPFPEYPRTCASIIVEVNNTDRTAYNANRTTLANDFYQTSHGQIQHLSFGDNFLDGVVTSVDFLDVYTGPDGVKYLGADLIGLQASLNPNKTYYPLLECGDRLYSDYTNITPQLSVAIKSANRPATLEPITRDVFNLVELHMTQPVKSIVSKPMAPKSPSTLTFNLNFPHGHVPSTNCSAIVVQTPKNGYVTSQQQTNFYTTTASQFASSLHTGGQYLGGTIVYASNVNIYNDDKGSKYVQIDKSSLTNFDTNSYNYYPAFVCVDANNTGIYSNYGSVSSFNMNGGVLDPVTIDFNSQPRRTTITAQPNPSSALFNANLTFSGVTVPSQSCEYIIISTTHGTAYNISAVASGLYSKSLTQLQALQKGATFTGGTIEYANSNETMLQDPKGQIYLSANIAGADIVAKDYYPIVVCDTTYSDFLNVTKFTSADGHNIDPLDVKLLQPTLSIQPNDDVIFGTNAVNASTTLDAFNQNGSQYNFVLDLGNMPDPQNASCTYAASIDYEGALSRGEALQFPKTEADFASLYPGGSFGNSETNGVLAVVKNPVLHHVTSNNNIGTGTGYYLGIRIDIAKPVHVYLNVALCVLAGPNIYPGFANASNTTSYDHDTVQELKFDVFYKTMPQTATHDSTRLNISNSPAQIHVKLEPDSTLSGDVLEDAIRNDKCSSTGHQMTVAMPHGSLSSLQSIFRTFHDYETVLPYGKPLDGVLNPGASGPAAHGEKGFQLQTDYRGIFMRATNMESEAAGNSVRKGWGLDDSNSDIYHLIACDMGNGHKFKTDLNKLQPGHFVTNRTTNQVEFQPRPYIIPITNTN